MSKKNLEQDSIDSLTARIEALELENRHLRSRVVILEEAENKKREKSPPRRSSAYARRLSSTHRRSDTNPIPRYRRDKRGNQIDIDNRVYLVTKGVHSSRRGIVMSITNMYIYVDNEDGIEQYRIAKNVLIEHKYCDREES